MISQSRLCYLKTHCNKNSISLIAFCICPAHLSNRVPMQVERRRDLENEKHFKNTTQSHFTIDRYIAYRDFLYGLTDNLLKSYLIDSSSVGIYAFFSSRHQKFRNALTIAIRVFALGFKLKGGIITGHSSLYFLSCFSSLD